MKAKIFFGTVLWGLALPVLAAASPSIQGSTGNIDTPSADVLRPGQFSSAYYRLPGGSAASLSVNISKNLELSAARIEAERGADYTGINLKYALSQEGIMTPGLAVGIEDISNEADRSVYAVASKTLPLGLRLHAGYGSGRYEKGFYAVEKKLVPLSIGGVFPDTSLIVENDGDHMNYGLRLSLAAGLKATAGWRDGDTFLGITYNYY